MEDLTGLGKVAESVAKIADSQLAIKAYDDLLADAMKEGGKALAHVIRGLRLFTVPFQFLELWRDRLMARLEQARAKVPEDRQQEAAPSIALPILMDLRFMEDNNPLTGLFLNLLARAIDKERSNEAHPAFVKIIEQMSPDEAMVMYWFRQNRSLSWPTLRTATKDSVFPIVHPRDSEFYLRHLVTLHLLAMGARRSEVAITISKFGQRFVTACFPEDFDLANFKSDQANVAD